MQGFIGDDRKDLYVDLYTDADLAGCPHTAKSSNGIFVAFSGPNSFFPVNAQSKKQEAISQSTTEAEIVAAYNGISSEGLPLLECLSVLRRDKIGKLYFGEDNTATIQVIKAGYSVKLRYMNRIHRIDIAWLSQVFEEVPNTNFYHWLTDRQRADLLTKAFGSADKFADVRRLVGIVAPGEVPTSYQITQGVIISLLLTLLGPRLRLDLRVVRKLSLRVCALPAHR